MRVQRRSQYDLGLQVHAPIRDGVAQTIPAAVVYLQSPYFRFATFYKLNLRGPGVRADERALIKVPFRSRALVPVGASPKEWA
jgi:hypothetical protein